jgi:hypothetical protein
MLYPGESIVCNETDFVLVSGSFETAGAADPTNIRGSGFSLTYNTTGVMDLTFANLNMGLVSCVASVQADTADTLDDLGVQVGLYVQATGVLQLLTHDFVATPALADGTGPRINFVALLHRRDSLNITRTA